jgi:hypothetical protein
MDESLSEIDDGWHLRIWTTVLQGLGYSFLIMGTGVAVWIISRDISAGEDSLLPVWVFGLAILLSTWTLSALLIVIGSYTDLLTRHPHP